MIRPIFRGMAERLYPTTHKTLASLKEAGLRLHAFCLRPGCGWHADVDIDFMIAKLGGGFSSAQPAVVPKLVCSQCGSKEIAVVLSGADDVSPQAAEHIRDSWRRRRPEHRQGAQVVNAKETPMKKPTRSPGDPNRKLELEARLDDEVSVLVAEANDAGYGTEEALEALDEVVDNQKAIYSEDPDPADDPQER